MPLLPDLPFLRSVLPSLTLFYHLFWAYLLSTPVLLYQHFQQCADSLQCCKVLYNASVAAYASRTYVMLKHVFDTIGLLNKFFPLITCLTLVCQGESGVSHLFRAPLVLQWICLKSDLSDYVGSLIKGVLLLWSFSIKRRRCSLCPLYVSLCLSFHPWMVACGNSIPH